MNNKEVPQEVDLVFKEIDDAELLKKQEVSKEHADVGPSSLYGRRGDNITFHSQGGYARGYWERMWSWVWKDFLNAFLGLFRIFFSRKD